jgi:preprotein translocase subunit SecE
MNRINTFVRESYTELMTKVSWPTWDELQSSAAIVTVAALIISVIVLVMDAASNSVFSFFYQSF